MGEPDYYELIGVERTATLPEISRQRAKFRKKAYNVQWAGDPKKFELLNKAYNVLMDQEKRRRYDATGRTEQSAEEEFAASFGGGRLSQNQRPKGADDKAVVNMQDRMSAQGPSPHEDGFADWLRQRDQSEMVMTDKAPEQHVLGSPKTDAYGQALGGAVQVQSKPRPLKKTIEAEATTMAAEQQAAFGAALVTPAALARTALKARIMAEIEAELSQKEEDLWEGLWRRGQAEIRRLRQEQKHLTGCVGRLQERQAAIVAENQKIRGALLDVASKVETVVKEMRDVLGALSTSM